MSHDVVVIGSGPGGYVCAIKAAQLGLKTAIIEKRATLGGTCLNIGCIPSKAMLYASEMFEHAGHGLAALGVKVGKPELDLKAMMAHKDATVKSNVDGVAFLMKKNKVDVFRGTGSITGPGKVKVAGEGGETVLETRNIVIATGSDVAGIPGVNVDIDEKVIVSSTGALELGKVPASMIVVGGGVIGLELGSVWNRLGAKVTVVEYLDKLLGGMDGEVSKQFQRIIAKQGLDIRLSSKVTGVEKSGKGAKVTFEPVKGGDSETLSADIVLIATGRRPYTEGLGLEAAGVEYVSGKFPFSANGRARAMNSTDGFVKFLADKATDRVLGVHIVGRGAGEIIHEAAVLMEFGGSSEDLGRTCHAHPTMSEAVREAALATFAKPLHI